jgi:RNase P protein component
LRHWFEDRSWSFRNHGRTNLLLELMTSELAGKATTRNYTKRIAAEVVQQLPGMAPRHLIYGSSRLH